LQRVDDPGLVAWLEGSGDSLTGYDAVGWEANAWILHAMYDASSFPASLSHDDVYRIERAAGTIVPDDLDVFVEELVPEAILTGRWSGRSEHPGPPWERLLWRDLARRLGIDSFSGARMPLPARFGYRSWPASIEPPAEGSLDHEQFLRLLAHLEAHEPAGSSARCYALYAAATSGVGEEAIYAGELGGLASLDDDDDEEDIPGAPTDLWPPDRSWLVYTGFDVCATRVGGSRERIERALDDPELETVVLDA
jgi:hypothetical protein